MTRIVVIEAGRSAVTPDDPAQPDVPAGLVDQVISALLSRASLGPEELTHVFLADGSSAAPGIGMDAPTQRGFLAGLPTTLSCNSLAGLVQAVRAIERNPAEIAVVAASDLGHDPSPDSARDAEAERCRQVAQEVAVRWRVAQEEMDDWANSSYDRSAECSAAGDFETEIVSPGAVTDRLCPPDTTARPGRGASAVILTSEATALALGLRFRGHVQTTCAADYELDLGIGPVSPRVIGELLRPCRLDVRRLDQLEVPERYAVTPVAWLKQVGISKYFVNPRGGDLGLGHLPRSGHLRSLVTMLNSLEATGGRTGAVVDTVRSRATTIAAILTTGGSRTTTIPLSVPSGRLARNEVPA